MTCSRAAQASVMKKISVAFLTALAVSSQASVFTVHANVSVWVQTPVITNKFGFAVFPASKDQHMDHLGQADSTGLSNPTAITFGGNHSLDANGWANSDPVMNSIATADASSAQKFNLGNLTGDIGPAEVLHVKLGYSYNWSVDLSTATDESAAGTISLNLAGTQLVIEAFAINGNDFVSQGGTGSGTVDVDLNPNSVTSKFFNGSVTGNATSPMSPAPVPEPASLTAVAAGLIALVRRRTKAA